MNSRSPFGAPGGNPGALRAPGAPGCMAPPIAILRPRPISNHNGAWRRYTPKSIKFLVTSNPVPSWFFLNPERVYRQGTQNQLCERSTETDVFPKKLLKETEGKIPPQIFGRRRARGSKKLSKGASLRKRRSLLTYPLASGAGPTKGYIAKEAPSWAFLNPERV